MVVISGLVPVPAGANDIWAKLPSPVLQATPGPVGTYDYRLQKPSVVKVGDTYMVWYDGDAGKGMAYRSIALATSPDGITWTKYPGNPVIAHGRCAEVLYVPDDPAGQVYKMWFSGTGVADNRNAIQFASSPDGITWTITPNVLLPGPDPYDAVAAEDPGVIQLDGQYVMYYSTTASVGTYGNCIARAISSDGVNWTKTGVVINRGPLPWDSGRSNAPDVVVHNGIVEVYYTGSTGGVDRQIGMAYSADGINFTKSAFNPVVPASFLPGTFDQYVLDPTVLVGECGERMWFTGYDYTPVPPAPSGPHFLAMAVTTYTFLGFLQPINMPPEAMSVFKQKSTIPVKFRLLDAATGCPIPDATATIWVECVAEGVPTGINEPFIPTQPDGGDTFRYDSTDGQYIFNLSTKNLTAGATYRIHANIMNGLMDQWVDVALR